MTEPILAVPQEVLTRIAVIARRFSAVAIQV
jgi:hypothetical protein